MKLKTEGMDSNGSHFGKLTQFYKSPTRATRYSLLIVPFLSLKRASFCLPACLSVCRVWFSGFTCLSDGQSKYLSSYVPVKRIFKHLSILVFRCVLASL